MFCTIIFAFKVLKYVAVYFVSQLSGKKRKKINTHTFVRFEIDIYSQVLYMFINAYTIGIYKYLYIRTVKYPLGQRSGQVCVASSVSVPYD